MTEKVAKALTGVELDLFVEAGDWPPEDELRGLAETAIAAALAEIAVPGEGTELSMVFSDDAHIRALNAQWRGKDKPTNVLSFPAFPLKPGAKELPPMLGDIVLAWETVVREAELDGKVLAHHITHLLVHGFLHLVGHDHEEDDEAEAMETLERRILARLAIADPYG